jgi:hypothetical protein
MPRNEILTEWTERLRSGTLKQGTGALRKIDESRCCLGVLGDVLVDRGFAEWSDRGAWNYTLRAVDLTGDALHAERYSDSESLPSAFVNIIGEGDEYRNIEIINRLIEMNDDEQKSFEQIADFVDDGFEEENPL